MDIYGTPENLKAKYHGVQCKGKDQNYGGKVTATELKEEIAKADKFRPKLEHWILATSAQNDEAIQKLAREISVERAKKGQFPVKVLGWGEIHMLLADNPTVAKLYYPEHVLDHVELMEGVKDIVDAANFQRLGAEEQRVVDRELQREVLRLRQSRFFANFQLREEVTRLVSRIKAGEWSRVSSETMAMCLAWCARLSAWPEPAEYSQEILNRARAIADVPESLIAEAFLAAQVSTDTSALYLIKDLDLPEARTAALMIVARNNGVPAAIKWIKDSQYTLDQFDPDGKFNLISHRLGQEMWDEAYELVQDLTDDDYAECPALLLTTAVTYVCQTTASELRHAVLNAPPFEMENFPLASDQSSIELRRRARILLDRCADAAERLGQIQSKAIAEDYSLWLAARDPRDRESARTIVERGLSDPKLLLRRLHFAFHFGVDFDPNVVEAEIERQVAQAGRVPSDAGQARFVLALRQKSDREVADYIEQYRDEIYESIQVPAVALIEMQALARAGLSEKAEQVLASLTEEELSREDRDSCSAVHRSSSRVRYGGALA